MPVDSRRVSAGSPRVTAGAVIDPATGRRWAPATPTPPPLADALAFAARGLREQVALRTGPRPESVVATNGPAAAMSMSQAAAVANTTLTDVVGSIQQVIRAVVDHVTAAITTVVGIVGEVVHDVARAVVVTVRRVVTAVGNAIEIVRHPAPYANGPTVGIPDAPTGAVAGDLGFTAPGDLPLTYAVTTGPTRGIVTVTSSGAYTYIPTQDARFAADGNAALTDTFVVTASTRFGSTTQVVTVPVAPARYVVQLPDSVLSAREPNFTPDGKSVVFSAVPQGGGRAEIYRVDLDGSNLHCLSCGLAPGVTADLSKPFAMANGTDYLLSGGIQSPTGGTSADHYVLRCTGGDGGCGEGSSLKLINLPTQYAPGVVVVQTREMRIAPDSTHIGYTQLLASGTKTVLVTIVGTLQEGESGYEIVDNRVVYDAGEVKAFTPDGKGLIVTDFYGRYNQGNADNVVVNLEDGTITRLTANLDYDESTNISPNGQWLVVGSSRTLDYLTPMTQVVRPTFVPAYVVFPTFLAKRGTTNQAWVVSPADELAGLDGIFLGDPTREYVSRPVANWNFTGTAVTFWEASVADPTQSRLVVTYLNDFGGGTLPTDTSTPDMSSWAPALSGFVPTLPPLEPSRAGLVGGNAQVAKSVSGNKTTTTVTYTNFEDSSGYILNGTESTVANATFTSITYNANITVTDATGTEIGWLRANNVVIANQQTIQGTIESSMNGNHLVMGTPAV